MKAQTYTLRWRGRETGPYPLPVLERMLEDNQICIWHEVLQDGQWITVEDLLRALAPNPQPAVARSQPQPTPAPTPAQRAAHSEVPRRAKLPTLHKRGGAGGA